MNFQNFNDDEIKLLLNLTNPMTQLTVGDNGRIVKRGVVSYFFYSLGVYRERDDHRLKERMNALIDQLLEGDKSDPCSAQDHVWKKIKTMTGQESSVESIDLFLKRIGLFKETQVDKSKLKTMFNSIEKFKKENDFRSDFQKLFFLEEKKHLKERLLDFSQKIESLDHNDLKRVLIQEYERLANDLEPRKKDAELTSYLLDLKRKIAHLSSTNDSLSLEQLKHMVQYDLMEVQLLSKIARMNFLSKIGIMGSSDKGATGTILVKDLSQRVLGVFKPDGVYASVTIKIKEMFKKRFGQLSLLSQSKYARPKAEYVSYRIDRFFAIGSVPASRLVIFNGAQGVFQLAASVAQKTRQAKKESSSDIGSRLKEAKDVQRLLNKDRFKESELELFQRFAIHDFLIGNLDAHEENWFIDSNDKGEMTAIIGIDKANSWIEKNPNPGDSRTRNQYKWKGMTIAQQPFTSSMRNLMRSFTEEKMEQFFKEIEAEFPDFFNEKIKTLALERAARLVTMGGESDSTPASLAVAHTL